MECLFKAAPGKSNATEAAEKKQLTLTVNNADQAKAKIYWVFHVEGNSLSEISNSEMNQIKKMFWDSKTDVKCEMSRTKLAFIKSLFFTWNFY